MTDTLATPALASYEPVPYRVDPDEAVTCPHCKLKDDVDASYCDQCGTELTGRDDVKVGDEAPVQDYAPEPYDPKADETVQCPDCQKMNDPDCRFCDQCGASLVGRSDVKTDGPVEDVDDVDRSGVKTGATRDADTSASDPEDGQCPICLNINDAGASTCGQCGVEISGAETADEDGADTEETESGASDPSGDVENVDDDSARSIGPKENLLRARFGDAVGLRSIDGGTSDGTLMFGHFSTFNTWYEIDSYWEGLFMESVASSAFDRTMVEDRDSMRVLYDHGMDPVLGNKPLGPITELKADDIGAYYEVPLLDTDYNRDFVQPALRGQLMNGQEVGSQLGASFRFEVMEEVWNYSPEPSTFNPDGIPQRTITRARVMEFGPVTFPASPSASSGVRSTTDLFIERLRKEPLALARFTERTSYKVVERILTGTPSTRSASRNITDKAAADGHAATVRQAQLRRKAQVLLATT